MSMSRKNYVAIAEAINVNIKMARAFTNGAFAVSRLTDAANEMATHFEIENDNFDRSRFIDACTK